MPHQMHLRAFDAAEKLLYEQYTSMGDWYDGDHPLLDDEDRTRAYYRVRSIVGEEINADGTIAAKFRNSYSEQGELVACHVWENGGWVDDGLFISMAKEA